MLSAHEHHPPITLIFQKQEASVLRFLGMSSCWRMFPVNQHNKAFNHATEAGGLCCVFLSMILLATWLVGDRSSFVVQFVSSSYGDHLLESLLHRAAALSKRWEMTRAEVPGVVLDKYMAVEDLKMWALDAAASTVQDQEDDLHWLGNCLRKMHVSLVFEGCLSHATDFLDKDWFTHADTPQAVEEATVHHACPGYIIIVEGKSFTVFGIKEQNVLVLYDSHVFDVAHLEQSCAAVLLSAKDFLTHLFLVFAGE